MIVLIANPKGGVGKSTAATNLAGYYASRGYRTMLGDLDRQQSAVAWLAIRPESAPRIESWDRDDKRVARPPAGVTHVVLDSPAGLRGGDLKDVLKLSDRVIVPLQPSIFDIFATQTFLAKLAERGTLGDAGRLACLACAWTNARGPLSSYIGLSTASGYRSSDICAIRKIMSTWRRRDSRCGTSHRAALPRIGTSGNHCLRGSTSRYAGALTLCWLSRRRGDRLCDESDLHQSRLLRR